MLWIFNYPLDMMALIGIILLIGIVKKKRDHDDRLRIGAERDRNMAAGRGDLSGRLAQNSRPIMMTTMSALSAAYPDGWGPSRFGVEAAAGIRHRRRPLLSQMLTCSRLRLSISISTGSAHWIRGTPAKGRTGAAPNGRPPRSLCQARLDACKLVDVRPWRAIPNP